MPAARSTAVRVGALRFAVPILVTTLIFSIISLGLSATYGVKLAGAPLDPWMLAHPRAYPDIHRWSTAFFVFYSGTMPFLTLLHASLDLVLHFLALLNPLYALTGSLAFLTGWAVQLGFWTQCDITSNMNVNGGRGTCYQFFVEKTRDNGDLVGVPVGLANAKVAFGYMLLVLYIAYVGFAAASVHKQRMQRKQASPEAKEFDSERNSSTAM